MPSPRTGLCTGHVTGLATTRYATWFCPLLLRRRISCLSLVRNTEHEQWWIQRGRGIQKCTKHIGSAQIGTHPARNQDSPLISIFKPDSNSFFDF